MISVHPFFAQQSLPVEIVTGSWTKMDSSTRDILIILGAVALVTLLVVVWAVLFRKRKRRHSHRHSHHHHNHSHSSERTSAPEVKSEEESPTEEPGMERKRRRHRRRREHRPRNPTLAETGGLPPLRTGGPPDPYP